MTAEDFPGMADTAYVEVFVARQAILDRQQSLYAYELLFRGDGVHNEFDGTESGTATTQVISHTLLSAGLENILAGKKGFLNAPAGEGFELLLELPEAVDCDRTAGIGKAYERPGGAVLFDPRSGLHSGAG